MGSGAARRLDSHSLAIIFLYKNAGLKCDENVIMHGHSYLSILLKTAAGGSGKGKKSGQKFFSIWKINS